MWLALGLIAGWQASITTFAGLPPAGQLDFSQAVNRALAQTPQMLKARAQLVEARSGTRAARGHLLPQLNASFTAMESDNPLNVFGMKLSQGRATFNDFGANEFLGPQSLDVAPSHLDTPGWYGNYQPKLSLEIPVYNGGQGWGGLTQARAYLAAARQGNTAARQGMLLEVLDAYAGVETAESFVVVAHQAVTAASSDVALSEKLFAQGVVSKSDLLRARLHLADARLSGEAAGNALANQRARLRMLVGWPVGAPVHPSQRIHIPLSDMTLAVLQQDGVNANPGVRMHLLQVQAAEAGVRMARASYLPHFNIDISREWNSPTLNGGPGTYTIAGVLSWHLFDFGARRGALDSAEARVMQKQAEAREARQQTELAIGQSWRAVQLAEERISARQQAIAEATEAERLARLRYAKGVSTITDLLTAQTALDQARSQLIAARFQALMTRAQLLRAIGQLRLNALVVGPLGQPGA